MSSRLAVRHGIWSHQPSVQAAMAVLVVQKPRVLWCEPTPTRERLDEFPGLWVEPSSPPNSQSVEIEEARLFWHDGWVHLLTGKSGVRWAAFYEENQTPKEENRTPKWLSAVPTSEGTTELAWPVMVRSAQPILLLQDLRRYGLTKYKDKLANRLKVIKYYTGSTLVGWRLEA